MIATALGAATLLLIAATGPSLSPEGYGWLRIGMSEDDAIAGASRIPERATETDDPAECTEFSLDPAAGMMFLTEHHRVTRITVNDPGYATPDGIEVGDPAAKVRALYGDKVEREEAPYADDPAEDLYVWLAPEKGYRFEVDERGVIRSIHAGTSSIRLIEGCL
ncbi:MAG: hypothetical protein KF842_02100 [Caulobacter sp.]|nr:hypothetical protein [Caulobacter sp.]